MGRNDRLWNSIGPDDPQHVCSTLFTQTEMRDLSGHHLGLISAPCFQFENASDAEMVDIPVLVAVFTLNTNRQPMIFVSAVIIVKDQPRGFGDDQVEIAVAIQIRGGTGDG